MILEMQKEADAMVIGGGLGRTKDVIAVVKEILKKTKIPTVIDADALYAITERLDQNYILTPHSHEFAILSGIQPSTELHKRILEVKLLANKLNCTVLLKGHVDIVSDGVSYATSSTGNPYMTKGGMGDILAGICGALLARGVAPFEAATAAAYINGKAGDLAARHFQEGLLASDLFTFIPEALK
jgi:NAD(P)H-hydrate epimerase